MKKELIERRLQRWPKKIRTRLIVARMMRSTLSIGLDEYLSSDKS